MLIGNKEILLIGVPFLKDTTYINKNVEDKTIQGAIKTAQDVWLREVIGEELLTKLCQLVADNAMTGIYKQFVELHVRNFLQYRTMAELQIPITNKLREQGVINTQGTEYQPITKNEIDYNRQYYINLAGQVQLNMVKWLDENIKSIPEWKNAACRDVNKYTCNICL